eukprot:s1910_g5.t1
MFPSGLWGEDFGLDPWRRWSGRSSFRVSAIITHVMEEPQQIHFYEVVERAQLARRLDATMLEVVAARQAAETANAQAAALRAELAAVTGRIEAQRPNGCSPLDVAFS